MFKCRRRQISGGECSRRNQTGFLGRKWWLAEEGACRQQPVHYVIVIVLIILVMFIIAAKIVIMLIFATTLVNFVATRLYTIGGVASRQVDMYEPEEDIWTDGSYPSLRW